MNRLIKIIPFVLLLMIGTICIILYLCVYSYKPKVIRINEELELEADVRAEVLLRTKDGDSFGIWGYYKAYFLYESLLILYEWKSEELNCFYLIDINTLKEGEQNNIEKFNSLDVLCNDIGVQKEQIIWKYIFDEYTIE